MPRTKKTCIIFAVMLLLIILIVIGLYNGIIQINYLSKKDFPVRGVDVSSYQGDIDWDVLAKEHISFAYLKATEGSSHVDSKFSQNWNGAIQTDLVIGAYHFFSFDSSGENQANNFINNVPRLKNSLPPAVDLEFYGSYNADNITQTKSDEILEELFVFINILKNYYGLTPVIYVTEDSYKTFDIGKYKYPLWVRSVYSKISFQENEEWCFWQYSNRKRLKGYDGEEVYIDMNTFHGDYDDFHEFIEVNSN